MITSMEVDQQVCSILSSLSDFFKTFSLLLDESATRVDLLLKGLNGHAPLTHSKMSPLTSSFSKMLPSAPSPYQKSPTMPSTFPSLLFLAIFFICISLFSTVCAFPPPGPLPISSSLHTMSINANGLSNPMKINAIQDMVNSAQPRILVIGETKSTNEVGS